MYALKEKPNKPLKSNVYQKQNAPAGLFQLMSSRAETTAQKKLQEVADNSPKMMQLKTIQTMADNNPPAFAQYSPIQAMMARSVIQCQRPVTNRMKKNMQQSLARVFKGKPSQYEIDQDTGKTFPDGPPHYTTGHHGVKVTDTQDGSVYYCDFHQDGAYYTRG